MTPIAAASANASQAGAAHAKRSAKRRAAASANKGVSGALNPAFVFATLSAKLSQDDVVLNEAIRNGPILQEHITRTKPQSYVGLAGGGLGFCGGMALGLKLAQPDRRIVQVIGDGGFHFSSPDSVYAVAQQYQIPILTVVLDNGGWQAVKSAVQRVYPKGIAAETDQFQSRLTSGRQGERGISPRSDARSAPMANASASRTNLPPRSTAALPRLMTARPPCCMFTSRGCEDQAATQGEFNEDAGPYFLLRHLLDRDGRDDFRLGPGRPGEISDEDRSTSSSASRPAAATTSSRGSSGRNCPKASASPSSSRTSRAAAPSSRPNMSRNRRRTATRCW